MAALRPFRRRKLCLHNADTVDLDRLYAAAKAERGTLDIVFANAGTGGPLALGKITAAHIDETFDVNVEGTIFTV